MNRTCGGCTLCCKLLPMQHADKHEYLDVAEQMILAGMVEDNYFRGAMQDFDKPAGKPCPYQRHNKGCKVYAKRPFGCRVWNCQWLGNTDTAALARPDRSHYVIDISPDYVIAGDDQTGESYTLPVMQVWVDPGFRDAYKDPAFLAFLKKQIDSGVVMGAIIRWNEREDSMTLFYANGKWIEKTAGYIEPRSHSAMEKLAALGPYKIEFTK